jgi:cation transport ATPase
MNLTVERDELLSRRFYLAIFYICAIMMAVITFYSIYTSLNEYLNTGNVIIGEVLVNTEFPFKGLAKLVTYLMIVSVVGWYCVTKLGGDKVKDIPKSMKTILQLVVLVILIISIYEFFYNFIIWNALITADLIQGELKLDALYMPYPNPHTPWNLVFATKMSLAALVISSHGFYIISKKM